MSGNSTHFWRWVDKLIWTTIFVFGNGLSKYDLSPTLSSFSCYIYAHIPANGRYMCFNSMVYQHIWTHTYKYIYNIYVYTYKYEYFSQSSSMVSTVQKDTLTSLRFLKRKMSERTRLISAHRITFRVGAHIFTWKYSNSNNNKKTHTHTTMKGQNIYKTIIWVQIQNNWKTQLQINPLPWLYLCRCLQTPRNCQVI